tara:strand:+ start:1278 stop:2057 length:780 start_codon:yes stop_codon:yes gene_type:complete
MAWQDEYDQVEDRLKKFWKDNPNGRVDTKIIHVSEDFKNAIHRCEIYKDIADDNPVATGIAQDQHGPVGANKTSWIENGETSAIGRALANWKYAAKKRPSVTEMQKVENLSGNIEVTKTVSKTSNSNTYSPPPSVQKKLEGAVTEQDLQGKSVQEKLDTIGVEIEEKIVITKGTVEPRCISCDSELWDNRMDKATGKISQGYPDWKCKNRDCKAGKDGKPRAYYMESFNAEQQAPEEWYMPELVKAKDVEEIKENEAPF